MTDITSKQGAVKASEKDLYNFLTDLRNLEQYVPHDKIDNWTADEHQCSFTIPQIGSVTLKITEKEPYHMIRVEPVGGSTPFSFRFFIQLKQVDTKDTRVRLTLRAELNMMMKTMFHGQIRKGLDQIVDSLSLIDIPSDQ